VKSVSTTYVGHHLPVRPVVAKGSLSCLSLRSDLDLLRKSGEFFVMKEDLDDQAEAANEGI
jgi:hypothetical protein